MHPSYTTPPSHAARHCPDPCSSPCLFPIHILSGEGRIHDCLRSNRAQLSEECRREELLLEEMVSVTHTHILAYTNIRTCLTPHVLATGCHFMTTTVRMSWHWTHARTFGDNHSVVHQPACGGCGVVHANNGTLCHDSHTLCPHAVCPQEAENVELRPGVMRACKDERHMFCKGVIPGGARMFR